MKKKLLLMVTLLLSGLLAVNALASAQNKVVVVPLGGTKTDANLLPENICLGSTIFGVTGTKFCTAQTYGTVTSAGQVWMDRNLGATQVATSMTDAAAYGDLYQWGRPTATRAAPA